MENKEGIVVAVDFDGTCVTHDYPKVGREIGAPLILRRIIDGGHRIMLWTMRGNKPTSDDVNTLEDAVEWFKKHNIPLWGVNENPEQTESGWTNSNKQYAQIYIDDAALGCPILYNPSFHSRPYVNWDRVGEILEQTGLIKKLI